MKHLPIIIIFFLINGIFSANAQDLVILKDGNIIESIVTEISNLEIRYKRFDHLDGPVIVISRVDVLSIRYKNGTVEIINATGTARKESIQENSPARQSGLPPLLQFAINQLPAIPIAGKKLKFELSSDTWTAKVDGRDFLSGTLTFLNTDESCILMLKQTHTYLRGKRINTPGPDINLEYLKGPPASLKSISGSEVKNRQIVPTVAQIPPKNTIAINEDTNDVSAHYNTPQIPAPVIEIPENFTVEKITGQPQKLVGEKYVNIIIGEVLGKNTSIRTPTNSTLVLTDGNITFTIIRQQIGKISEFALRYYKE